jgi:FKBP-type peptidyl-prolyl cis-trans isomerase 2
LRRRGGGTKVVIVGDFSQKRIKVGAGEILTSLEEALVGRMEGDSVAVFLTSDNGYGSSAMGTVEENTALMWVLNVEQIKKN